MTPHDCVSQFVSRWLQRGDCILDVGANQGLCALSALDIVGAYGSVHAFEPNPDLAARLRDKGPGRPLTVVEAGASDRVGEAEFFLDVREACGSVASSIEKLADLHNQNCVRAVNIALTTLDAYCEEHGLSPRFIKIDVEGHEVSVFRGAAQTINRCRPILVFEFWESWWDRGVSQIFQFLQQDYALIRLQDGQMVNDWYQTQRRSGIVDIGCIPIWRGAMPPLRPEILAPVPLSAAACA